MLQKILQALTEENAALRLIETPYSDLACPAAGTWLLAADETGILRLTSLLALSAEPKDAAEAIAALPQARKRAQSVCEAAEAMLQSWWAGEIESLTGPVFRLSERLPGTPFEKRIWKAARFVPPGARISYSRLAAAIGRPSGAQAAGNALRRNPVILVTPCHRVLPEAAVRAGTLEQVGGFSGALTGPLTELKRRMLAWEEARFTPDEDWEDSFRMIASAFRGV